MGRIGCLFALLVIAVLAGETWVYLWVSHDMAIRFTGETEYILPLLVIFAGMYAGWRLVKYHVSRIPMAFMQGHAGRHVVGVLAGVLLLIPGLATDMVGLVLLLPPVGALGNRLGNRVMASIARQTLGRMMAGGGGFPGFPGGAPNAGLSGFPGMSPRGFPGLTPDDQRSFPLPKSPSPKSPLPGTFPGNPGKTYDTTVDKE